MKQSCISCFAFSLVLLIACNAQPAPSAGKESASKATPMTCDQLDGKQYNITLTTGGKVEGSEILSFKNQLVESSECLKYGFNAVPYQCKVSGNGALAVEVVMTSEKEGRMDWKASITESGVKGTILWVKAGQADIAYTFEGPAK